MTALTMLKKTSFSKDATPGRPTIGMKGGLRMAFTVFRDIIL